MRTTSLVLGLVFFFAFNTSVYAKSADAFHKRFKILRDSNGALIGIKDRTLPTKFAIAPYIQMIKENLVKEQELMSTENLLDGSYDDSIVNLMQEDEAYFISNGYTAQEYNQNVKRLIDSLKQLATLNVERTFTHPAFKDVVGQFEGKINQALLNLDPTILANVQESNFFYRRNVSYQAVSFALNFAKKRLSEVPLLNTASFVIVEVEKLITERRNFHQNMLLHYLENFDEKELGLTHEEVNYVWSSIYESRIPWYAFWESNAARGNWAKYGVNNFYYNFRVASNTMRRATPLYTEVGERINFAFQEAVYNNEKVMVNLFNRESSLQSRPAIAFNFDRPTQIVRKRIMLNLAQLGLSFVPLPSMIKNTVDGFIKSHYVSQKITEGALYGHFESTGNTKGLRQVKAQYLNPFDSLILE